MNRSQGIWYNLGSDFWGGELRQNTAMYVGAGVVLRCIVGESESYHTQPTVSVSTCFIPGVRLYEQAEDPDLTVIGVE